MQFLTILIELLMFSLAVWKLYELCFGIVQKKAEKKMVEVQSKILMTFFAEFTYKTMQNNDNYETAPDEIFVWLNKNFQEWVLSRSNKTE